MHMVSIVPVLVDAWVHVGLYNAVLQDCDDRCSETSEQLTPEVVLKATLHDFEDKGF